VEVGGGGGVVGRGVWEVVVGGWWVVWRGVWCGWCGGVFKEFSPTEPRRQQSVCGGHGSHDSQFSGKHDELSGQVDGEWLAGEAINVHLYPGLYYHEILQYTH
jgi:hypothetical protein